MPTDTVYIYTKNIFYIYMQNIQNIKIFIYEIPYQTLYHKYNVILYHKCLYLVTLNVYINN